MYNMKGILGRQKKGINAIQRQGIHNMFKK